VQLVEFTKEGAKASALLGYGNASRPGSPHITDQLSYFEAKTLRPTFRTRDEVERNKVSRECVPAPCGFSRWELPRRPDRGRGAAPSTCSV